MKRIITFSALVFITALLFSSCSKSDQLNHREQKLVGTWQIEKVTWCKPFAVLPEEQTDQFAGSSLTFHEDRTLAMIDASGTEFIGTWDLQREHVQADGSASSMEFIDLNLFDRATGASASHLGRGVYISKQKLRYVSGDFSDGQYTYRWKK